MNNAINPNYLSNIEFLKSLYKDIWWNMPINICNMPLEATSYLKKKNTEKKFERFIDEIVRVINNFPKEEDKRELWKKNGNDLIESTLFEEESFKLGKLDERMKKQFFTSTKKFIDKCKEFDSKMTYSDIGQAMRNVWIINILQKVMNIDISFTMAIFGYSMLYPYTDNYLDDVNISMEEKKKFNQRLCEKLKGEEVKSKNFHEEQVFSLVEAIESVFSREEYPKVFKSLLLIYQGQVNSLSQQEGISNPYEKDMLDISIEKGGASVIVDGYLIRGELTVEEEIFTYGYGFLLQLCDDLQDVKGDCENNHMTIMSQLAGRYNLDNIVNKLINLTIYVVDEASCFKGENIEELKKLIKDNCLLMIIFAVVMNKGYFSDKYAKEISKYLPFTLSYIEGIKDRMKKKFRGIEKSYYGVSLEDIIYYLIE